MCGIIAIYNADGLDKMDISKFVKMLMIAEERGDQATGVGLMNQRVWKMPVTASRAILGNLKDRDHKMRVINFLQEAEGQRCLVGHTRQATQGDPGDNRNNHPIRVHGLDAFIVHNGVVGTDAFEVDHSLTDTYIIANAIARVWKPGSLHDSVREAYGLFWGNANVFAASKKEFVVASRNSYSNPLEFGSLPSGTKVFASRGVLTYEVSNRKEIKDGWSLGYHSGKEEAVAGELPKERRHVSQIDQSLVVRSMGHTGQTSIGGWRGRNIGSGRTLYAPFETDDDEIREVNEVMGEQDDDAVPVNDETRVLRAVYKMPRATYALLIAENLGVSGGVDALDSILDKLEREGLIESYSYDGQPGYKTTAKGRGTLGIGQKQIASTSQSSESAIASRIPSPHDILTYLARMSKQNKTEKFSDVASALGVGTYGHLFHSRVHQLHNAGYVHFFESGLLVITQKGLESLGVKQHNLSRYASLVKDGKIIQQQKGVRRWRR